MAETGGIFTKEYTTMIQKVVNQVVNDPKTYKGSQYMPAINLPVDRIYVDVVEASGGMTLEHTLGTEPKTVAGVGTFTESFSGGAWKETMIMNEPEIIKLRELGSRDPSLRGARQMINFNVDKLNRRLETRIEYLRWQALINGSFSYLNKTVSFGVPAGNQATPVTAVWATGSPLATNQSARPVNDLRYWLSGGLAAFRKYVVRKIVMNPNTARWILENTSVQSLISTRFSAENFAGFGLQETLQFLLPGLPPVEVYNGWYQSETLSGDKITVGDATYFLPDGYIFFEVGNLPGGDRYGEFVEGANLANGSMDSLGSGKYLLIEDNTAPGTQGGPANPFIKMVAGVHGGPKLDRPFDVLTAKVIA